MSYRCLCGQERGDGSVFTLFRCKPDLLQLSFRERFYFALTYGFLPSLAPVAEPTSVDVALANSLVGSPEIVVFYMLNEVAFAVNMHYVASSATSSRR